MKNITGALSIELSENKDIKDLSPLSFIDYIRDNLLEENVDVERAMRFNGGKTRWSLIDFNSLEGMVDVLEYGTKKYSPNNWKKGLNTTDVFDSLMRHLIAYLSGEDNDIESGLPHTGHILCNAMFLAYMERFNKTFDNRFVDGNKTKCCGNWDENGVCKCRG